MTTDDEAVCPNPQNASIASSGMGFDYVEPVESGSSLATPPSSIPDDPFASESLGDTVIRLDRVHTILPNILLEHMYIAATL